MIRKLLLAGLVVSASAGFSFAQNARVNALAGMFTIEDMSWVLSNPAYALDYEDAVQATYSGVTSSPLIGVKSIGDMLAVGATYQAGATPPSAPHLLLGMDLDFAKLGVDVFYERSITSGKSKDVDDGAGTTDITENRNVTSNPGLKLGLNLDVDVAALAIVLGARVPGTKVYSRTESTAAGITSTNETTTSGRDVALDAGVEAALEALGLDLTVGLVGAAEFSGKMTTEQAATTTGGASTDTSFESGSKTRDLRLQLYLGAANELDEHNALVAAQVELGINRNVNGPFEIDSGSYDPGKVGTNDLYLNIRGAVEKTFAELKHLDEIVLRSGLVYGVSTGITHEDGEVTGLSHMDRTKASASRINPLTGVNGFDLTLGFGLRKGIVSFDAELAPAALVNTFKLVNGQFAATTDDFGSATLTFDFKQKSAKKGMASMPSYDSPSTTPAIPDATF